MPTVEKTLFASKRNPWVGLGSLGFALGLHLALWHALLEPAAPRTDPPAAVRVTILRLPLPVAAPTQAPPVDRPRPVDGPSRRAPRAMPKAQDAEAPSIPLAVPAATPPPEVAASPLASPASAALPSLLDTAATRRAIREAARQPSMADLGDAPLRADQRLRDAIAASAKGDCLKGEFAGGGMGLLSLPFWALAQLRDQCSK